MNPVRRLYLMMLVVLSGGFAALQLPVSGQDQRLTVYTPQSSFSVSVQSLEAGEYVNLLEILERLSTVQAQASGRTLQVRVNALQGEFQDGRKDFRVGRTLVRLNLPLVISGDRVLYPLVNLPVALIQFLNAKPRFHPSGRRLFLGDSISPIEYELRQGEPQTLRLTFSVPVNPQISTDGARLRLVFPREPVVLTSDHIEFEGHLVTAMSFSEQNGSAEVMVTGSSPLAASLHDGGRTLIIRAASSQAPDVVAGGNAPVAAQQPQPGSGNGLPQPAPAEAAAGPTSTGVSTYFTGGAPRFFILLDAAHGGRDTGTPLSDSLMEKDVTLALARRLKTELNARGLAVMLSREGESDLGPGERALAANAHRAGMYIVLHAGEAGRGVRLYTALLPPEDPGMTARVGPFVPWNRAQALYLERSRAIAADAVQALAERKIPAMSLPSGVVPLRHVAAPALAIEVAPPSAAAGVKGLQDARYLQSVAQALSDAIVRSRGTGGDAP